LVYCRGTCVHASGLEYLQAFRVAISAKRAAYICEFGDIESYEVVISVCGNRNCVNPDHLKIDSLKIRILRQSERDGECMVWTGPTMSSGYGRTNFDYRGMSAHRASWEAHFGEIPDGMFVLHDCDNKLCVNPDHLHIGTQADNVREAFERGLVTTGSDRRQSKLTEKNVNLIRESYANGEMNQIELGERFGVSDSTIADAIHRRTWKHVP